MRTVGEWLAGVVLAGVTAPPALGGLVVTSYRTVAQTNGYAPVSQAQYFAEQRLENVSPALAEVSGDWTGPNADGTPDTWHFVGTSGSTSTTTITTDSYTVLAAASFLYTLDTTTDFIDPASVSTFAPAGAANYRGSFTLDVPAAYTITSRLNQWSRVRLNRLGGGPEIFDASNVNVVPQFVSLAGTIPPGQYQFLATTGLSLGNLFNGVNDIDRSGSFENLIFSVRVPEPSIFGFGGAVGAALLECRRKRPRAN